MGRDLAESLEIKLYDKEWDVRDNVVEFIGGLFAAVSRLISIILFHFAWIHVTHAIMETERCST